MFNDAAATPISILCVAIISGFPSDFLEDWFYVTF